MQIAARDLAALAGAFARPEDRPGAAEALAHTLGGEALLLFSPDPELDVLLPAPGLPQTLPQAGPWREFVNETLRSGSTTGTRVWKRTTFTWSMRDSRAIRSSSRRGDRISGSPPVTITSQICGRAAI